MLTSSRLCRGESGLSLMSLSEATGDERPRGMMSALLVYKPRSGDLVYRLVNGLDASSADKIIPYRQVTPLRRYMRGCVMGYLLDTESNAERPSLLSISLMRTQVSVRRETLSTGTCKCATWYLEKSSF